MCQMAEITPQKLGLLAFVWILFQVFIGAGSVWFDGKLFGGGMKAKAVWKYHRLVSWCRFTSLTGANKTLEGYQATSYSLCSC